ncbi:MAG TPA: ATP-binding protein [Kofleriaceae bacterium]|nr:ATP-binding protein [Kofleriaceae bacterium]
MTSSARTFPIFGVHSALQRPIAWLGLHAISIAVALVAIFALLDHVTGVEATFVVLTYLLPISLVTWFRSRGAALSIAALATACSTWIFLAAQPEWTAGGAVLNALGAYGMFVVTIAILRALRRHVEREQLGRRAAVEQLRHADRLQVIGTLSAGVAHELGTPLNVISGAAEMIGDASASRVRIGELSALILRQTEQITSIIRQLLDFGRRGGPSTQEIDLDRAVTLTAEMLRAAARKRNVAIELDQMLGDRGVHANARELEQVVSNLMLNGIQAMPGGGTLRVSTRAEARADGEWAAIVVQDQGEGIRPEHLPYIFDPFFTTKGIGEGTGLGLSVSYGIVSDWGGKIEVDSRPGHGAQFAVLLPMEPRETLMQRR